MNVIKRDKSIEKFDINKIFTAVESAFTANKLEMPATLYKKLLTTFKSFDPNIDDTINIDVIQDRVEYILITAGYVNIAKSYIIYREKHNKIRGFVEKKLNFINNYKNSTNTANATIDDNSNVSNHNIAVLNSEIHKEENRDTNLRLLRDKLHELYPDFNYKQMDIDFETIGYLHDSSSQIGMPYCVAISLYPFLLNGLKDLGGLSAAPKNIDSFCGMFVNLIFSIAGQYKGAVATPGVLLTMNWFLEKEFGVNYYQKADAITTSDHILRQKTIRNQIHQYFQQICYTLMQPSGSRGCQAVFWNLSIFDKPFFDTMYGDFCFPDGSKPNWESLNWLQKDFMQWFNAERLKCVLTFPVVSACLIYQDGKFLDEDLADFIAQEYSEGDSFFTYISDSADSLSSCCRLSSKIEKPQFSFTNGQLSEMTGSKNVITLDLNRIIQDIIRSFSTYTEDNFYNTRNSWKNNREDYIEYLKQDLIDILDNIYKYQTAYNECLMDFYKANMLTVYNAGFIDMKKQYLTIGINGLNQAAEFLGIECNNNEDYKEFCNLIFSTIKEQNLKHKTKDLMFNTEFTP